MHASRIMRSLRSVLGKMMAQRTLVASDVGVPTLTKG